MTFTEYLQHQQLAKNSIAHYERGITMFITWLDTEQITASSFHYNDLMAFIEHCYANGASKRTMTGQLTSVRHYCRYLIHEQKRTDNPATGVFIKGLSRGIPVNLLNTEELDTLYQLYKIQLHVNVSNKIMLGLLIYQGITVGELAKLKPHHFLVKDGKMFIKGTHHTNERTLSLQAHQMHLLQQYLKAGKQKEGYLFVEARKQQISEHNINNRMQWMFHQLRELNPKVVNAKQIRMSVITNWLKKHSLRETQYLAGHKYVSSTARYQTTNLDDLQQALKDHHPLK